MFIALFQHPTRRRARSEKHLKNMPPYSCVNSQQKPHKDPREKSEKGSRSHIWTSGR